MSESGGGEYGEGFAEERDEFFGEEDGNSLQESGAPGVGEGDEELEEEETRGEGWKAK